MSYEEDGFSPVKRELPVEFNLKDVVFGSPLPAQSTSGKRVALKGFAHLATSGIKDPEVLSQRIDALFRMQDVLKPLPDFGLGAGIKWARGLGEMARASLNTGTGLVDQPPAAAEPGLALPSVPPRPSPPLPYDDSQARQALYERLATPFTPKPFSLKDVDPFNRSMLIGSLIGDLLRHRGRNIGRIAKGFIGGQQALWEQQNQAALSRHQLAQEIAKMQLGDLQRSTDWRNQMALRQYMEDLDAYNTAQLKREEQQAKFDFNKAVSLTPDERKLLDQLNDTRTLPQERASRARLLASSLKSRAMGLASSGAMRPDVVNTLLTLSAHYNDEADRIETFRSPKAERELAAVAKMSEESKALLQELELKKRDVESKISKRDMDAWTAYNRLLQQGLLSQEMMKWRWAALDLDERKFRALENSRERDRDLRLANLFMMGADKQKKIALQEHERLMRQRAQEARRAPTEYLSQEERIELERQMQHWFASEREKDPQFNPTDFEIGLFRMSLPLYQKGQTLQQSALQVLDERINEAAERANSAGKAYEESAERVLRARESQLQVDIGESIYGGGDYGGAGGYSPFPVTPGAVKFNGKLPKPELRKMIEKAAYENGLDPALLEAVVAQESGFNPTAISPAGAIGLAQLMPGTAAALGVDPYDPEQNLRGGARYLAQQLRKFGDLSLALAAYNAGPGRVAQAGNRIPDIDETKRYVAAVLANYKARKAHYNAQLQYKDPRDYRSSGGGR